MSFFEGLLKSLSKNSKNKNDENFPNLYMEDGQLSVKNIKELSDEELVEIVGFLLICKYLDLLNYHKSYKNKKVTWNYITYMETCNDYSVEFIDRSYSYGHLDANNLIPYINKLERPYTISYIRPKPDTIICPKIKITFINIPTYETKSEEDEKQYLESMINKMNSLWRESSIYKRCMNISKNNAVDKNSL